MKKKLLGILLAVCLGTVACGQTESTKQEQGNQVGESPSVEEASSQESSNYEWPSHGRWGNLVAGVSY